MIWLVPLLPMAVGLVLWAAGGGRGLLGGVAAATLLATAALALWAGLSVYGWAPGLELRAELTVLARAVAVVVPLVAAAVAIYAAAHEHMIGLPRMVGLLLVFTGAMEMVVIADDLVTLLIGWELMGALSWALIGHTREDKSLRSANYAFVATRLGDLGLFMALFAVLSAGGSASYASLGELEGWRLAVAAFGLLVAAAAKAGQVPFSPWLFRAMDGPTPVSALLHSSTMVAAGAYLLARLHPWLSGAPGFEAATVAVGLTTALAGGFVAVGQVHSKKLLAGSTSAQIGLMFAAVGAGYPVVAVLHLITHAFFKAPLFFAAGIAKQTVGSFDLREMRVGRTLPLAALATLVVAAAVGGVPPLGGAWTKEEVVKALGEHALWLALIGALAGALSGAYAARFAYLGFWPHRRGTPPRRAGAQTASLAVLAAVSLLLGALWLKKVSEPVAKALGGELPPSETLLMVVSLALVALGIVLGIVLARRPVEHAWADWLGLPGLIDRALVAPVRDGAARSGDWDDRLFDAIPRGATAAGLRLTSGRASGWDGGLPPASVQQDPGGLLLWDRGTDAIPEGTARAAGWAGRKARQLQTGMSHHYYLLLAGGVAAGALLLIIGG